MSGQKRDTAHDEAAVLAALRAAGYCGAARPGGGGRCTRRPGHDDDHVDYYNGRTCVTDIEGYRWPQR
ncbi:hypothetical protein ACIQMV_09020 [Streptomyces sp. NPDC091412]|uniref:hypothetical protein n=1 Tax=Streptomyces sp. NPDC091412 TaxID=3366002 RepID=UPI00381EC787